LPSASNGPPEHALAITSAVGVGGIEDGHAEVQSLPDKFYSIAASAAEGYAAEAKMAETRGFPRVREP
jgi:hypothetical protein